MTGVDPTSDGIESALGRSQNPVPKILILGGTGEGSELASRLAQRIDLLAISSLAGRVSALKRPEGVVRVGGFGGVDGLGSYLVKEDIKMVVDSTHPFATRISRNAEIACASLGVPLVAFTRPPWVRTKKDIWHEVVNFDEAARVVDSGKGRVFLSIGRQEVDRFAACHKAWFLIRAIEEPTGPLPALHEILLRRGPYRLDEELQLLRDYSINCIISKNSGGSATYSKIEAAQMLRIPVIMVKRPVKRLVRTVETVEDVIVEIDRVVQGNRTTR